jgi:hypothetical protein
MARKPEIDPALVSQALALSGEISADAVVARALEEFIARRSQKGLSELFRKLEWDPAFKHKRERGR